MALGEFELIEAYFRRDSRAPGVIRGIGDDCALLQLPPGQCLATTVDTLVEGRHFPTGADPEDIAQRALRVNLSDVAAMGAEPLWFTLALTLPEPRESWLEAFSRGLFEAAREYRCVLVGGDTTRGPLTITIQVMAAVSPDRALRRDGAAAGDLVYVTGTLGDGAAALAFLKGDLEMTGEAADYLKTRFYKPLPRLVEGRMLAGLASAAIDISDGLLADLGHICEASGVAASLAVEQLPLSEALAALPDRRQALNWALAGGDDYELCFTVPPDRAGAVDKLIGAGQLIAAPVGRLEAGGGLTCTYQGRDFAPEKTGYQHFDSDHRDA